MWRLIITYSLLLITGTTYCYKCKISVFTNISVKVNTTNGMNETVKLNSCPMSTLKLSERTTKIECINQNIPELPALSVSYLHYLTKIDLSNNGIKYIRPNSFYEVSSLAYINLENNEIEEVWNNCFAHVESLETLKLSNNKIKRIENAAFRGLSKLKNIFFDYNELSEWNSNWFDSAVKLRDIVVHNNQIKYLPRAAFSKNKKLVSIDFSFNAMESVHSETFLGFTTMYSIRLDNNFIKSFHPDTFAPFNGSVQTYTKQQRKELASQGYYPSYDRLTKLYINNNRLTYLPRKMLSDLHETSDINLHSNPFKCSCYMEIIRWFIKNKNVGLDIFKETCARKSNPVCATSLRDPLNCVEEIDDEVEQFYFENFNTVDFSQVDVKLQNDLMC